MFPAGKGTAVSQEPTAVPSRGAVLRALLLSHVPAAVLGPALELGQNRFRSLTREVRSAVELTCSIYAAQGNFSCKICAGVLD